MALDPNNSFADLVPVSNDPGFTGYIPGIPKPDKPDDPLDEEKKRLDIQRTQQLIAKNADEDGKKTPEAKQYETSSAGFYSRMVNAENQYGDGVKPRGAVTQTVLDMLPDKLVYANESEDRRKADNLSDEWIRAKLRKESGAVIGADEMAKEYTTYFPQPGDTEADIARKKQLRAQATEAMRIQSGSSASAVQVLPGPNNATGDKAQPGVADLTDEQKHAYAAFIAASGGKPPPDQLKAFLEHLTGKTVSNADEIAKSIASGRGYSTTTQDLTYQQKIDDRLAKERKLGFSDAPVETLINQGATLNLSDEAAGVGNAAANVIMSPFTGKFDPVGAYQFGRDVERQNIDEARNQLGWAGTGLEVLGGFASASPGNALAALPSARSAIAAAATGGAIGGFGSGEGARQSELQMLLGAGTGAALQRTLPAIGDRLMRSGGRGMAPEVANAAEAEGVDLMRPMVDPEVRSDFGALESNAYSQPTIREATARIRNQIEGRVADLSQGGTPMETEAAGTAIQGAARRFIQRSRGVANTLYNRARTLAGDATVTPRAALGQLRNEMMQLRQAPNTNQGELDFINGLGEDLTSGPLTVDAIRSLRQSIRGRINEQNLTATQAEARATRIIDALQRDVGDSLPTAAATAFRRADSFYRERMVHIDDIVDRFLGGNVEQGQARLSGEQAFAKLKAMTSPGGDNRRLAALMRDLEPGERQDIAATIAQSLGRRSPEDPFSTRLFVSQSARLSPAARRTMFGEAGAQSIDNLRLLSQRLEGAESDINRSRSATVLERTGIRTAARAFIAGIAGLGGQAATGSLSGGVAGLAVAGGAMGVSAARKVLSARAMVNPRVSLWLAKAADVSTPSQAREAVRQLGVVIAREPLLANELKPIENFLSQRLGSPALADPQAQGDDNGQR